MLRLESRLVLYPEGLERPPDDPRDIDIAQRDLVTVHEGLAVAEELPLDDCE